MGAELRYKQALSRLEDHDKILNSNKKKIIDFLRSRQAKGNAPNTLLKYLYPLHQMNVFGWIDKPFESLTKEDIQDVVISVDEMSWSPKTKKNFHLALKVFYRWLEGEENFAPQGDYPDRVKFISTGIPKRNRKALTFNDILTREDVIKMAQCTKNPMHKALLWVTYESGGRPEEILNIKKSDIEFDAYGTKVFLNGAKSRRPVRLVSATEPLREWLRKHPSRNGDFGIWITQFSKQKEKGVLWTKLGGAGANKMLRILAREAGITNKKITMYSLRRGRATELAATLSRSVLHSYMGWEEGSSISSHYVKLSGSTIDEKILETNGIIVKKKEIPSFIECHVCRTKNSPDSLFCSNVECGKPLIITTESKPLMEEFDKMRSELEKVKVMLSAQQEFPHGKILDVQDEEGSKTVHLQPKGKYDEDFQHDLAELLLKHGAGKDVKITLIGKTESKTERKWKPSKI